MPEGGATPRPARLPGAAPAALRAFVACTTDRVELDLTDNAWVPKLPGMDTAPDVSIKDGATSSSATIRVGGEFIGIDLPVSIVDGALHVDSSNLGFESIGAEVDKWVDAFNATLRAGGKQLDGLAVNGDKITLTKKAIPPATEGGGAAVAPVTSAVPGTPGTSGTPAEEDSGSKPWGCFAGIIAGIVAIAVAIGLVATRGDDDNTQTAVQTPTVAPATTSTTSTTSTTTTTIAEVGQVPPPDDAPESLLADCGALDTLDPAPRTLDGYLLLPDDGGCNPVAGAYGSSNCATAFFDCSTAQAPGIAILGTPGTTHQYSVPDAVTGQEGQSAELFAILVRLFTDDLDQVVRVQSDCGGTLLTGESAVNLDGATTVEQRLDSFGECRIAKLEAAARKHVANNGVDWLDPDAVNRAAAVVREEVYVVDSSEPAASPPDPFRLVVTNNAFNVSNSWADSVNTVNNTLAASPVGNDCTWFFPPEDVDLVVKVLDGCANRDHFWVFAAATADIGVTFGNTDTLLASTATYANPLAQTMPPAADLDPFDTSIHLFDNSIFPCGYGHVAYTACDVAEPPMQAGGFVTVSGVMLDEIPIDSDGAKRLHRIDFVPDGPSYLVTQEQEGWSVTSSTGETRARALLRDDSMTLVAPHDELPAGALSYQWSTTVNDQTVTQPIVPVVGLITTPTILREAPPAAPSTTTILSATTEPLATEPPVAQPPAAGETLDSFYSQLTASLSSGDLGFSLDRLDPIVFEAYPTECPDALASFADPDLVIALVSDNGPEPWVWELSDGRTFDVPDAINVTLSLSGRGQSGTESTAHVTIIDGEYHWFTFCGAQ